MTARLFRDGMLALLIADPTFSAAVNATLGQTVATVLKSNLPIEQIPVAQFPCWVVEQGDGVTHSISNDDGYVQTIGLSQQSFSSELKLALVWQDNNRDTASDARSDLPTLMTQLLLRNPMPGGISGATFKAWAPDAAAYHPTQIWRATITGDYSVPKS